MKTSIIIAPLTNTACQKIYDFVQCLMCDYGKRNFTNYEHHATDVAFLLNYTSELTPEEKTEISNKAIKSDIVCIFINGEDPENFCNSRLIDLNYE